MATVYHYILSALVVIIYAACAAPHTSSDVTVAVAANFKATMDVLEDQFEAETGYQLTLSTGSTGQLYAQIRNGAPVDVFLSADQMRPNLLAADGQGLANTQFTYALGQLILWSPDHKKVSPEDLTSATTRKFAMANPALAPYGAAAESALSALHLQDIAPDKAVYGENINQAFVFIQTGNAELGFIARSQVLALPVEARGSHWTVPEALYPPIHQDAIQLKRAEDNTAASAFMRFLISERAGEIIEQAGYKRP